MQEPSWRDHLWSSVLPQNLVPGAIGIPLHRALKDPSTSTEVEAAMRDAWSLVAETCSVERFTEWLARRGFGPPPNPYDVVLAAEFDGYQVELSRHGLPGDAELALLTK